MHGRTPPTGRGVWWPWQQPPDRPEERRPYRKIVTVLRAVEGRRMAKRTVHDTPGRPAVTRNSGGRITAGPRGPEPRRAARRTQASAYGPGLRLLAGRLRYGPADRGAAEEEVARAGQGVAGQCQGAVGISAAGWARCTGSGRMTRIVLDIARGATRRRLDYETSVGRPRLLVSLRRTRSVVRSAAVTGSGRETAGRRVHLRDVRARGLLDQASAVLDSGRAGGHAAAEMEAVPGIMFPNR